MKRTHLAILFAIAGGIAPATVYAQAPSQFAPSAFAYGNYDYYSQPAQPTAAVRQPAPETAASATACDNTSGCSATACDSTCGCDNGCDNGCCKKHKCHGLIHIHECCPLECEDAETCRLFDCCCLNEKSIVINGWLAGGILGNGRTTADRFNGPVTFADRRDGQFNQGYIFAERTAADDNCGLFLGGRVDYLWGSDFFFTTAAGLDGSPDGNTPRWESTDSYLYGSAMPQLYVETAYNDLKIKWGHFYTIIGYEVVPAVGNFFYTHAYTMQYGEPFTHTGALASKPLGDNWTVHAGVTNGWDAFNTDTRANFLGGVTYATDDWGSLAFAIHTGDESITAPGVGPWANRTVYSIVWSRDFTSRLTYVLQHDRGYQDRDPIGEEAAEWYGINQYVFYKINCCWTAGARIEWFRDDDGYRVTGLRPGNAIAGASFPGNFYECTLGLNYKPNGNWMVRPEVRWDWFDGESATPGITGPYNAGTLDNQFTYGFDLIYQF